MTFVMSGRIDELRHGMAAEESVKSLCVRRGAIVEMYVQIAGNYQRCSSIHAAIKKV